MCVKFTLGGDGRLKVPTRHINILGVPARLSIFFLACPVSRRGLRNQLRALLGLDVSPPFVLE